MPDDQKTERDIFDVVYDAVEFVFWIGSVVCNPFSFFLSLVVLLGASFYLQSKHSQSARAARVAPIPLDQPYVDRAHDARYVPADPWAALTKKIVRPDVIHVTYKAR